MSSDHGPRLRALIDALHTVCVWSMVAPSDPHGSAAQYRGVLIEICNYVLKVQDADALRASASALPPQRMGFFDIAESVQRREQDAAASALPEKEQGDLPSLPEEKP